MTILVGTDQAALIIALILGIFRIDFHPFSRSTKAWYNAGSKHVKMSPPTWLFSIVWPILYILEITAMYRYIIHQAPFPGTHFDSVVFLFLVQAILCIMWYPTFFELKRVWMAGIFILLILVAQLACLSVMAVDGEWLSFGLMMILFCWCIFAGILNFYWVHVVRTHKEELSQYDSDNEEYYDDDENRRERRPANKKTVVPSY